MYIHVYAKAIPYLLKQKKISALILHNKNKTTHCNKKISMWIIRNNNKNNWHNCKNEHFSANSSSENLLSWIKLKLNDCQLCVRIMGSILINIY